MTLPCNEIRNRVFLDNRATAAMRREKQKRGAGA